MFDENKIKQAKDLFGDFSGHLLDQEYEIDLDNLKDDDGNVIFAFGRLDGLEAVNGEYLEFTPDIAPLICSSYDGEQLYIIGGDFELSENFPPFPLFAVEYSTYRDYKFEQYRHEFDKSDLPIVEYEPDSNTLLIVEGRYRFTDRGIVND